MIFLSCKSNASMIKVDFWTPSCCNVFFEKSFCKTASCLGQMRHPTLGGGGVKITGRWQGDADVDWNEGREKGCPLLLYILAKGIWKIKKENENYV